MFNNFNALPLSDLFIAKRTQQHPMKWMLYDAYKVDREYDLKFLQNGMIQTNKNGTISMYGTNFLAYRRKNLQGLSLPCGLVVIP